MERLHDAMNCSSMSGCFISTDEMEEREEPECDRSMKCMRNDEDVQIEINWFALQDAYAIVVTEEELKIQSVLSVQKDTTNAPPSHQRRRFRSSLFQDRRTRASAEAPFPLRSARSKTRPYSLNNVDTKHALCSL
jgi:hypothetical protein